MAGSIRIRLVCIACVLLGGCATGMPADALRLSPDAPANREMQSHVYPDIAEGKVLAAAASQLQDLGFVVDDSETRLGLIVASKERSAVNESERTTAILLSVLSILAMAPSEPVYARKQIVRVAVVTYPDGDPVAGTGPVVVRVTFQRTVFDNVGRLYSLEAVNDPNVYREFFERLSQSIFLEQHAP